MTLAQKYRDTRRFKKLADVLYKHDLGHVVEDLDLKKHLTFHKRLQSDKFDKKTKPSPKKLKDVMEELSGLFARFGRLLSSKIDFIPIEYRKEFSNLRDKKKSINYIFIKRILEKELNTPVSKIFSKIDKTPIYSSTLNQVHRAVLKSGDQVLIKVQKPNINTLLETDMEVLYNVASLIEKNYKNLGIKPTELVKEFDNNLKKELNYLNEAKNIENLYESVKKDDFVKIPKVYPEYSTKKVLTTEFLTGKKLSEVGDVKRLKLSKEILSKNILDSFFSQILYHNIFHPDPNENNIVLLEDNKFGLLNSGSAININQELNAKIENVLVSLALTDRELLLKSLMSLFKADKDVDLDEFKEELFFYLGEHYDHEFNIDINAFANNIFSTTKKYNVSVPIEFVALTNSLVTLENTIKKIDNKSNLSGSLKHNAEEIMKIRDDSSHAVSSIRKNLRDLKEAIRTLPIEINKSLSAQRKQKFGYSDISKFTADLNRSSKRLTMGLISAALIISGTLTILAGLPPLYYNLSLLGTIFILAAIVLLGSLIMNK